MIMAIHRCKKCEKELTPIYSWHSKDICNDCKNKPQQSDASK